MKIEPGLVTQLAFSGGKGSTCILAMVLDGVIPKPRNFIVINADPGMENRDTLKTVDRYEKECKEQNIPFIRVKRSLYQELLNLKASGATRFDHPPFWTKNPKTGKRGRLMQQCTKEYKIEIMDRALRLWMEKNLGISSKSRRIGYGSVIKWIGFTDSEWHRIKESERKYIKFEYPLIERRLKDKDILEYFISTKRPIPVRSVCAACFANDIKYFEDMYNNRPEEWEMAVKVDEAIRDLSQLYVKEECYVSSTLVPLKDMPQLKFEGKDQELITCHSGHCFI